MMSINIYHLSMLITTKMFDSRKLWELIVETNGMQCSADCAVQTEGDRLRE